MSTVPPVGDDRGIQKPDSNKQPPSPEDQKATTLAKIIIAKGTHYTRELDVKEQYSIVQRERGWFWGNLTVLAIRFFDLIRNKEATHEVKLTLQEAQDCLKSAIKSQNKSEITFLENYIVTWHSAKLTEDTTQAAPHDYMDHSWQEKVLKEIDQTIHFCAEQNFSSLKNNLDELKTAFQKQWEELAKKAEFSLKESLQAAQQADKSKGEQENDPVQLQEQLLLLQDTTIAHLRGEIDTLKKQELDLDLQITQEKNEAESKAKEEYLSRKQNEMEENQHTIDEKTSIIQDLNEKLSRMATELHRMQPEASNADRELANGALDLLGTKKKLVQAQFDRIAVYKKTQEEVRIFQAELDDMLNKRKTYDIQLEATGAKAIAAYERQNFELLTRLAETKKNLHEKNQELATKEQEKLQMIATLDELRSANKPQNP